MSSEILKQTIDYLTYISNLDFYTLDNTYSEISKELTEIKHLINMIENMQD